MVNTILQVSDFENLTSNYYLSTLSSGTYYSSTTLSRLPSVISNVEVNLNAMLNGRLYKRYPPGNVQYNGYNGLTPQVEKQTLLQALTECVEYKLITQQYVNLNNTYSGTVNGSNNYQTQNNNVIGLRQDITAKLTLLGLYASILLGDKKPKSVLEAGDGSQSGTFIDYGNWQQWINFIQHTQWVFSNTCTFNGGINTTNLNADTLNATTTNSTTVNATKINTNELNVNDNNVNLNVNSVITSYNGCNYTFPTDTLRLVNPWSVDLSDWSFFSEPVNASLTFPQNYNQGRIEGVWKQPNGKVYLQNPDSTYTQQYTVIKCHNQILNGIPSSYFTKATWYSINKDGVISIDLATMWNDAYNSSDWFNMTVFYDNLQQYDPSIPPPSQWSNYQVIIDKVVGRINCIGEVDSQGNASRTSYLVDPIYTGYVGLTLMPTITGTSFTVGGSIVSGGISSGTISPWWSNSNSQSLSQINLALDVYFSIVIINT